MCEVTITGPKLNVVPSITPVMSSSFTSTSVVLSFLNACATIVFGGSIACPFCKNCMGKGGAIVMSTFVLLVLLEGTISTFSISASPIFLMNNGTCAANCPLSFGPKNNSMFLLTWSAYLGFQTYTSTGKLFWKPFPTKTTSNENFC